VVNEYGDAAVGNVCQLVVSITARREYALLGRVAQISKRVRGVIKLNDEFAFGGHVLQAQVNVGRIALNR
jgi:predicted amino acid-binding ACT domain protein